MLRRLTKSKPLLAILGSVPAVVLVAALLFGVPGLGERNGPPVEDLVVERTVLKPGVIELTVRNQGPDPVRVAQISVNDAFANFRATGKPIKRLRAQKFEIYQHWIDGQTYDLVLLTESGASFDHQIAAAVVTPKLDVHFIGLMVLLGVYVGVIPIALGMLWLPILRNARRSVSSFVMAVTVGLLGFLAVDTLLEGFELAKGAEGFGGAILVPLGALASYLLLQGTAALLRSRSDHRQAEQTTGVSGGFSLALLIAVGIGLHNFGEGLVIGTAYAIGSLALGSSLVIGFALHNTTEGLAIVAPIAGDSKKLKRLVGLGLVAGLPAVFGALLGATILTPAVAAVIFGVAAGAIGQVLVQLFPLLRNKQSNTWNHAATLGLLVGVVVMYLTGLLVTV